MTDDRFINPESTDAAQQQADELFVHGLLGLLHEKDRQRERINAAIAALGKAESIAPPAPIQVRRVPRHRRFRRVGAFIAVAVLAIGGVMLSELSGGSSAYAVVNASVDAAKGPGQHRYELRLAHFPEGELPKDATGTLDSTPTSFLLRFEAPDKHLVVVGKDDKGEWAIKLDGEIEREHPRSAWPRWAEVGDDSLLADSVDKLMEGLLGDFRLTIEGKQSLPGAQGGKQFNHIHGDRKPGAHKPQAEHVDLWIDPETKLLERLEMTWPRPMEQGGMPPRGQGGGPDGQGPRGPEFPGNRPPGGRPPIGPGFPGGRGGPGGRSEPRDGPDSPDGPDHRGGPDDAPDQAPDGGPGGMPPPGDQPEGRDGRPAGPDGMPPPRRGPRGDRPMPPPGGPDGHRGGPDVQRGPGGPDGEPQGPGRGRPRLAKLVLSRVDAPAFDNDWFSPEKHQAEAKPAEKK